MVKRGYVRPLDLKQGRVDLTHGSGGRAMVQLISELFARHLGNEYLGQGNDGAVLPAPTFDGRAGRIVMSTDCHVVSPLFFPGGDIGTVAVNGTVNDLAMCGAEPLYLSLGLILEEGLPLADLRARSWAIAELIMKQPRNIRRLTAAVVRRQWKRRLTQDLGFHISHEMLGARIAR